MHDEIRSQRCNDRIVHDGVLHDDAFDLRLSLQKRDALFKRYGGKAIVTHHLAVRKDSCNDRAVLLGFTQDISMPFVNHIGTEAGVSNIPHRFLLMRAMIPSLFP